MAEFHDGNNGAGGWTFYAYDDIRRQNDIRYWVNINDPPSGTCWGP